MINLEEIRKLCNTEGKITSIYAYNDVDPNSPTNGQLAGMKVTVQEDEKVQ